MTPFTTPRSSATLTVEEVERGYNNRAAVPEHPQWFERWANESQTVRARVRHRLDVRYGPDPKETLDLFFPEGAPRGTFVFIHGGYWRSLDKRDHAFVAPPFIAAGYAVALLNYDLCPDVGIGTIVEQCRRALLWLVHEGRAAGADPDRVVVSGHSAGGHLAAMLHATDWRALGLARHPVTGGVSLSGVHDLEPLLLFSYNADFRLDREEAVRLSPMHLQPTTDAPFLIGVGANETSEFLRQSQLLWEAWPRHRPAGARGVLAVAARHHFDVVMDYADPASELTRSALALFANA